MGSKGGREGGREGDVSFCEGMGWNGNRGEMKRWDGREREGGFWLVGSVVLCCVVA